MSCTGSCTCGAVRYEFDEAPILMVACHCALCRKAAGSAFATWLLVHLRSLRWGSGDDGIGEHHSSSHGRRLFCKLCGSALGNLTESRPNVMHLAAGTLDDDPGVRVSFHVFVSSKAPWSTITDSLPQYGELPPRS